MFLLLLINVMRPNFVKDNCVGILKLKDDTVRVIYRKTHKPFLRPMELVGLEPRVERILTEYRFLLFGTSLCFFG